MFGDLAEEGEEFLGTSGGEALRWRTPRGEALTWGARLVVTDRASYLATDPLLIRIPHTDVCRLAIDTGFPNDIEFALCAGVDLVSMSTREGTVMAGPPDVPIIGRRKRTGPLFVIFYPAAGQDCRSDLASAVSSAGGEVVELRTPYPA